MHTQIHTYIHSDDRRNQPSDPYESEGSPIQPRDLSCCYTSQYNTLGLFNVGLRVCSLNLDRISFFVLIIVNNKIFRQSSDVFGKQS
jgi:hypothetical protein